MSGADSDDSENERKSKDIINFGANEDKPMLSTLLTPPPLYSTEDYKIDGMQFTPQLVKSLMHRKVIKISSGGVHNICIVEHYPSYLQEDIYKQFMNGLYTDVEFKGFYLNYDAKEQEKVENPLNNSVHSLSDEEMTLGQSSSTNIEGSSTVERADPQSPPSDKKSSGCRKIDEFWKQKQRVECRIKISAHMGILASKSNSMHQLLLEATQIQKTDNKVKVVIDFKGQVMY